MYWLSVLTRGLLVCARVPLPLLQSKFIAASRSNGVAPVCDKTSRRWVRSDTRVDPEKHFRRHVKAAAELADVFGGEFTLSTQDFGDDAGSAKDVQQVFLMKFIGRHEFFQRGDGSGGLKRVVTLFEVFNQQGKKLCKALLGSA